MGLTLDMVVLKRIGRQDKRWGMLETPLWGRAGALIMRRQDVMLTVMNVHLLLEREMLDR